MAISEQGEKILDRLYTLTFDKKIDWTRLKGRKIAADISGMAFILYLSRDGGTFWITVEDTGGKKLLKELSSRGENEDSKPKWVELYGLANDSECEIQILTVLDEVEKSAKPEEKPAE